MQSSRAAKKQQKQKQLRLGRSGGCKALCCSCRLSFSSSEEAGSSSNSERYPTISSLAHAMVQERLDQMITERKQQQQQQRREEEEEEARNQEYLRRRRSRGGSVDQGSKFIVMMAMEKSSYDPREDFKESIEQMITANRINEPRDLRRLLNYYVSMNSEEYQGVILEVFHEVCTNLFLSSKQSIFRGKYSYL